LEDGIINELRINKELFYIGGEERNGNLMINELKIKNIKKKEIGSIICDLKDLKEIFHFFVVYSMKVLQKKQIEN